MAAITGRQMVLATTAGPTDRFGSNHGSTTTAFLCFKEKYPEKMSLCLFIF
jgi:hypothetical protein